MLGGMSSDVLRQALEAGMTRSGSGDRKRTSSSVSRDHRDGDAENGDGSHVSSKKIRTAKKKQGPPSNFSRVDPSLPRSELEQKFPLFVDAQECLVEVQAGQMLYLPAGWFHEVRGFTGPVCLSWDCWVWYSRGISLGLVGLRERWAGRPTARRWFWVFRPVFCPRELCRA